MAAKLSLAGNAQRAATMDESERRRMALLAIQEHDLEALWNLVSAYLVLHGRRGSKISPATLRKYKLNIRLYWEWADSAGVMLTRPHRDAGQAYLRQLEAERAVVIKLGADCGLRDAEIAGLKRKDVHLHLDPPYVLIHGKGAKTREVVLSKRAEGALTR